MIEKKKIPTFRSSVEELQKIQHCLLCNMNLGLKNNCIAQKFRLFLLMIMFS